MNFKFFCTKKSTYLFFTFIWSIIFVFVIPPFQKPDEIVHFWNSAAINRHYNFKTRDSLIPKRLYKLPEKLDAFEIIHDYNKKYLWKLSLETDKNKELVNYKSTVLVNNFVSYLPGSLAVIVGSIFSFPVITVYLIRLFNLFFFLLCVITFIKITKNREKYLLLAYLLLPMLWFQASAISYDSVPLGLGLIYVGLFIRNLRLTKMSIKSFIIFILLGLLLQISKQGYYTLILLPLVLFFGKLKNLDRKNWFWYIIVYASTFLLSFSLFRYTYKLIGDFPQPEYDSVAQLNLIKTDPFYFLRVVQSSLHSDMADFWIKSFLGIFGWLDYGLNFTCYLIIFGIGAYFIYKYIKSKRIKNITWFSILSLAVVVFGGIALIIVSFYFTWSQVGSRIITGVQGRYFLVYFPLFIFWLKLLHDKLGADKFKNSLLGLGLVIIFSQIISSTYYRYFDYSMSFSNDSLIEEKVKNIKSKNEEELKNLKIDLVVGNNKFSGLQFYIKKQEKDGAEKKRTVYRYMVYDGNCKNTGKMLFRGYEDADYLTENKSINFHKIIDPKSTEVCVTFDRFTQGEEYENIFIVKDGQGYLIYPLLISK